MTAAPVVVAVDGSPDSAAAVRWGAVEARRRDAPLVLLSAFPWPEGARVPAPEGIDGRTVLHLAAGLVLEDMALAARHLYPEGRIATHLRVGGTDEVLAAASGSAQLVVVGSTSRSTLADLVLGSTAATLVQRARCPVTVVPGSGGNPVPGRRGVVVGVDGGAGDPAVTAFATAAAADRGCPLIAVHTWSHAVPGLASLALDPFVDPATAQHREETVLDDALAPVTAGHPEVAVQRVVERDSPAAVLLSAARDAELVVLGHRHRPVGRLGSVTHAVLHRATCPVAVVPLGVRSPEPAAG